MDAALEAANPAKTSRLDMLLIPSIFLVGSDSGLAVARESGGIALRLMWSNSNDLDSKTVLTLDGS